MRGRAGELETTDVAVIRGYMEKVLMVQCSLAIHDRCRCSVPDDIQRLVDVYGIVIGTIPDTYSVPAVRSFDGRLNIRVIAVPIRINDICCC